MSRLLRTLIAILVFAAVGLGSNQSANAAPRTFAADTLERGLQELMDRDRELNTALASRIVKPKVVKKAARKAWGWTKEAAKLWSFDKVMDAAYEALTNPPGASYACAKGGACD